MFSVLLRWVSVGGAVAMEMHMLSSNQGKVVVNSLLGEEVKVGPGSLVLNCDVKVPLFTSGEEMSV